MTNDLPSPDKPASPPRVARWYEERSAFLMAIGLGCGLLRGVAIVATGPGGIAPWAEAGYSLLLHVAAGLLASVPVRGLGDWLSLLDRRAIQAPAEPRSTQPDAPPVEPVAEPPGPAPAPRESPGRWRERLQAAREANDAARVLELREEAPEGLDEPTLGELDAELGRWMLTFVHRRLRSGPLQMDVVALVERASETFGHTKEGASLRAALPTLRRGAGLCPRCARPYVGVWEACPECMGRPEPPPPAIPGLATDEDDDYDSPPVDGRWFVDPDDEPRGDGRADR
ncbi:hypothetical protein [Paludisphaera sp.]|uniref:hypothetical protein n=1 Tax=Paludisphaera sp. TaxID=2017432 RepID=UPI00301B8D28